MIVLDTSAPIDLFRGSERIREYLGEDATTTKISCYEILAGVNHRKARREEQFFRRFFSEMEILDFDILDVEKAGEIMGFLFEEGEPVNALDVLMAGTAIANGAKSIISKDQCTEKISHVSELAVLIY
ncbi:MAG: type II toxin-antitoxin system VapC family toxin [Methanotrichaceae archaeon]|nr:type II toxin-antitoxin system VapC family toxin [Methanotrichaceae archaeon]